MSEEAKIWLTVLGVMAVVIGVFVFLSVYKADIYYNPITERWEGVALSAARQIEIGNEASPQFEREYGGPYPDRALQRRVYLLGVSLLSALRSWERSFGGGAKWTLFPFRFRVLSSGKVNAFALPGGPVYITYGLLSKLRTDDQLAGVLGHELGHIVLRHTAKKVAEHLRYNAVLWGIQRLLGGEAAQWAEVGAALLSLQYSRDQEREADRFGFELVCRAGYDPHGLIQVFQLFQQMGASAGVLGFLSTHPDPGHRIRELQTLSCPRR